MNDKAREPAEADYRFWCEEKLRNADTDQQGHVNNAVIASLFEAGRIEVLTSPQIAEIRKATSIVVVKLLIHFRRELFFPGRVRIGSRVPRIGRTSLDFESAIAEANATRFGLAAGLISRNPALYDRFWSNARAGVINSNGIFSPGGNFALTHPAFPSPYPVGAAKECFSACLAESGNFTEKPSPSALADMNTKTFSFTLNALSPHGKSSRVCG
mgnify:CR=1 FL=1